MCDSIIIARPGEPTWIAKNSDRDADESQVAERTAAATHPVGSELRCTDQAIPQVATTYETLMSRPGWMWGCEMGVNAKGVAVANEAVFTRLPVADHGLLGTDLQRLALERSESAGDAVELMLELLSRYSQCSTMGGGPQAHSSFIIADADDAWILETAGEFWALQRVRGVRSISNALTIGADFDRVHPEAYATARARGWCRSAEDFSFARAFARPLYATLAGAGIRARCTSGLARLLAPRGRIGVAGLATLLRDHGGLDPAGGWRMRMPCAHASYLPTRTSGQTTASMIARLETSKTPQVWMTGTSSPCISVFKPLAFGGDCLAGLPGEGDPQSLWWRHERLHRTTILDYDRRRRAFERERGQLEARAWDTDPADVDACAELWRAHHAILPQWTAQARAVGRPGHRPFHLFWRAKARAAGVGVG